MQGPWLEMGGEEAGSGFPRPETQPSAPPPERIQPRRAGLLRADAGVPAPAALPGQPWEGLIPSACLEASSPCCREVRIPSQR